MTTAIKDKLLQNLNIIGGLIVIISALIAAYNTLATKSDLKTLSRKGVFASIELNLKMNKINS